MDAGGSGHHTPRLSSGAGDVRGSTLNERVADALARSPARFSATAVGGGAIARGGGEQQLPDEATFLEPYADQQQFYEMRARYGDLLGAYYDSRAELERLQAVRFH